MLLKGVEGGLTELQGDSFSYEDVDQRTTTTVGKKAPIVPVLYANKHSADYTRHVVCDITRNKEKAIRRVLERLRDVPLERKYQYRQLGDHRHDVFTTQEVKDYHVTFEELTEMMVWVWTMYAPGGQSLSKTEQKEAYEEFEEWRMSFTEQLPSQQPQSSSQQELPLPLPRLVSFLEFRAWFTHLTTHIERSRGTAIRSDKAPTTPKEVCRFSTHPINITPLSFQSIILFIFFIHSNIYDMNL